MTFLLERENTHASRRSNGKRGWYHPPPRKASIRLLVVHTSESAFDLEGTDTGAENVAKFLASSVDRPASYHDIVDGDSHVALLPWDHTAFGAVGHNSHSVHLAFAGIADDWSQLTAGQVDTRLERAAAVAAAVCRRFDIPPVHLADAPARTDARGVCGHGQLDPARRHDPGDRFPWDRFVAAVARRLGAKEEDVALTDEQKQDLDFAGRLRRILDEEGSNAGALKFMVRHLREHPGGVTIAQVRAIATEAAREVADGIDGDVDVDAIAERIETAARRRIIADLQPG